MSLIILPRVLIMKKQCEHSLYSDSKYSKRCSKCDIKILFFPDEAYSQEEFFKMYPLKQECGEIIIDDE